MPSDPSRTEALTAETLAQLKELDERATDLRREYHSHGDMGWAWLSRQETQVKLDRVECRLATLMRNHRPALLAAAARAEQAEAREQATREKVDELRTWLVARRSKHEPHCYCAACVELNLIIAALPAAGAAAATTDTPLTLTADDIAHGFQRSTP
jgi:hypothetical protein